MPATFTPSSVEVEKKHTGNGGRPPVDRRPTGGGGDGDNWSNRPPGKRGPRELLSRYRLGLFFALAGDLMFFVALVSAFFVRQTSGHFDAREQWINDWRPVLVPPILWLNTLVLLLSSFTMEISRRRLFHEPDVMEEWFGLGRPAARRAGPWLAATVLLGGLFLVGQVMAWKQLALNGAYYTTNPSSHFFYLLTATHAVHLLIGLGALTISGIGLMVAKRIEVRQILLDTSAWYWHTMGVLWIFLFVLLAFFQ
jgi:cytochrome c oxidase subunit 3